MILKTKSLLAPLVCVALAMGGCSPVFSDLQSARTVGKDKVEVTPHLTTTDNSQTHLGFQAAIGITPRFDIRMRYENVWTVGGEFSDGISLLGIGPKISLLENRIAVSLPVGRALGQESRRTWQVHPTVLLTLPAIRDKLDITLAPKYLMTLCEECEDYIAVNLGLAFSGNLKKWAIRPEYGLLYTPGSKGHIVQFSIGISKVFGQ